MGYDLSKAEGPSERVAPRCGNHVVCDRGMRLRPIGRGEVDSGRLRPKDTAQAGRPRRGGLRQTIVECHGSSGQAAQRRARANSGREAPLRWAGRVEVDSGRLWPRAMAQAGRPHRGGLGRTVVERHRSSRQATQRWTQANCGRGPRLKQAGRVEVGSGEQWPRGIAQVGRPHRGGLWQIVAEGHSSGGQAAQSGLGRTVAERHSSGGQAA
ncbi:hypothetical protein C4D60_Mb09t18530 [Musa balbisiana]|uniref:Uncharacterized protein n=1 Tax=Musa balbisiana TaxID=52838 RepID=A0A4S8IJU5_MUSBA|nr:hypothetical protein C4D60_Mb09t18530 [Musa balbisiana]